MVKNFWRFITPILLLALLGMFFLTPHADMPVRAQDGSTPTPIPNADEPPISAVIDDATTTILNTLEGDVSLLRELNQTTPIDRRLVHPTELINFALAEANYTDEQAQNDARFYGAFGFMPEDTDLADLARNLMTEQLTGYFDATRNIMFIPNWGGLNAIYGAIYAHEYAQALIYQNFDVASLLDTTDPDQALAALALFEGDAQLTTAFYTGVVLQRNPAIANDLLTQTTLNNPPVYNNMPSILRAELFFPYTAGTEFVRVLYNQTQDWSLVNQAYVLPPVSTEQILHPEQYTQNDQPQAVSVRQLDEFFDSQDVAGDWELLRDQTLGEFYLREHLDLFVDTPVAVSTAAGWGGDRFLLYGEDNSPTTILVLHLTWDTEQDASEFYTIYGAALAVWFEVGGVTLNDSLSCWERPSRTACQFIEGRDTWVVIAPTSDLANQIMDYELEGALP
ncbi:MAG: hypothetical protein BroJett018_35850 [Chloroflexota bacterium]|nr:hypothetical protein [Chloroflexota bacterium]NOG64154.1 hypothetical protein [Chloroflexota bacterium]GIK65791.1 MAG: hypothetical protein BroJett018_35850 [Chloroflexota bacterium]